jgi:glucose-fructose oxidoreductase
VRYAVVGLGHIAQTAVLPAFEHATKNSKLVALFSEDPAKRKALSRQYRVPIVGAYEDYDAWLRSGEIDAVFIAEPNSLHLDFTRRAAQKGMHVLCEKPLAITEAQCRAMIDVCKRHHVKLMTAYRLHFEKANLEAIKIIQTGRLGQPRYFSSTFSMQTKEGNIRLQQKMGGGTLFDIGIYCINAARYLFRAEPIEVLAITANNGERRFREVEEMTGALLRFPEERLATFICSFGAADTANYEVVGTEGLLQLKNAYEYSMPTEMRVTLQGKTTTRQFEKRDQFGAELLYFSNCVLKNLEPEPSGIEGYNDVHIIRALYKSARTGRPVKLNPLKKTLWPSLNQEIDFPPSRQKKKVHAEAPSRD